MSSDLIFTGILLFGSLLLLLATGLPIVFCLSGVAAIGFLLKEGPVSILTVYYNLIGTDRFWLLSAIPLFIFMAEMLDKAGIGEELYRCMQNYVGKVPGGLAARTVLISTVFAALVGESSASLLTIGIIALPSMLKRGYDKSVALGSILAGGGLGIIIPPSVVMIVYATEGSAQEPDIAISVGKFFLGGIVPGLLLSALCITYILSICRLDPALAPVSPGNVRWKEKILSLQAIVLPGILVTVVIGSMLRGVATPTEAAAIGGFGALLVAGIRRKLTWKNFSETCYTTLRLTTVIMWLLITARCFRSFFVVTGFPALLTEALKTLPFGGWGALVVIHLVLLALGCFLDPFAVILIMSPIASTLIRTFGFDPVWFGILFVLNIGIAYNTPPVGLNIFYMKTIVPDEISVTDIYRSAIPYVIIELAVLVLIMVFPSIVLWLPDLLLE